MQVLTIALAQDIVARTMRIIAFNVNVMDARGTILASGDVGRIGQLHAGALLALAQQKTVEIDAAAARVMHGAQPGINLPLMIDGKACGAVGLSGPPGAVRQFGELVRLTAEMILEQARLSGALQRDARYRETFVLDLIRLDHGTRDDLAAWGRRLAFDFGRMQLAFVLQLDDNDHDHENDMAAAIVQLQMRLLARQPALLTAAVGPNTLVIIDHYDAPPAALDAPATRLQALAALLDDESAPPHTLAMGIAMRGITGAAVSYHSAQTALRIGRARHSGQRLIEYQQLALPVLLSGLDAGWQALQLRRPMASLQAHDKHGQLRRTVNAWFANNEQAQASADALHIHRNTLDYRLRRIADITGLDLARSEDRFLLYVSALLTPL